MTTPKPAIAPRAPAQKYFSINCVYVRGTNVGNVCRAAWPAGTYIPQTQQSYDPPRTGQPNVFANKSGITIYFPDGTSAPWAPTYSDIFSMDWMVYEVPPPAAATVAAPTSNAQGISR
jgi:hypothetical protein